ncbi:S-DNA-T family DNA segregation ATPase FtsK/SpoIIIE [Pseudoclavibacter sp. JAI123]|uniref:type VII secretion protein EccCa n=1 Tax=Pseudoclavibacter sp. JAI123 TaxID=2723065 RepID=UPI0015CE80AC|nr:type VII secretion protein EccCa [Pseudoclavibacter sp. JAI123]NYF11724.1 S-DNA-T family DNA segregation ATPase FtsK/SpoIIIE [Pseudoclavibacter sp. JAI123]
MSIRDAHRPTRTVFPAQRPEPRQLASPPTLSDEASATPFQFLLPVVGALTSVTMMVVMRNGQPLFLFIAGIVFVVAIVSGVGFAISARGRAGRALRIRRKRYLDYLERQRTELRDEAAGAARAARLVHPDRSGLASLVQDPARLWDRRRGDPDHLQARVGTATVPWFQLGVSAEDSPTEPADPILLREAQLLAETHSEVPGMPAVAELRGASVVAVIGPRERTVPLVRGLVAQLASHQLPDDVQLAAAFAPDRGDDWRGFDLLPHAQNPRLFDGPMPARRVAPDLRQLAAVIGSELLDRTQTAAAARRRGGTATTLTSLVVVDDRHGEPARPLQLPDRSYTPSEIGVTIVHLVDDRLHEPDDVDVRIELDADGGAALTHNAGGSEQRTLSFEADEVTSTAFEGLARTLAARRTFATVGARDDEGPAADIAEILGVPLDKPVALERVWAPRQPSEFLRVAFGVNDQGRPVHLDLKESAQQGMGPHGICIGATGSGKSEMLRTLILSLAVSHPPEDLAMILVDYKGGAAFAPFEGLPHLAGLIDNLADDPQLTVRAKASLQGEVVRRQQLLKAADSSPSISHYRELRRTRPELAPMPHLFVVIDEFGELLTAEPDFIDLFLQIGRIGRSIGVHLLLSSQRIEGGKLRGLDTYLSYRLGLRTFSEAESQVVLGSGDAFHLPPIPGYGYLKVDTSVYQRFHAGYVSGPIDEVAEARPVTDDEQPRIVEVPLFNGIDSGGDPDAPLVLRAPETRRTLIDDLVAQLDRPEKVRPVWLPPLAERISLGEAFAAGADSSADPSDSGEHPHGPANPGGAHPLRFVIGVEDEPGNQRQEPWVLDLTKSGGHVAIIGGPQSGRSTALRTIAASLALSGAPGAVGIYGMDLTGGGLRRLEAFPHVGGVATRGDDSRLVRLVEELTAMLRMREELFKRHSIDSTAQLRAMHAAGKLPGLPNADIVLLVDGYGALRQDFEHLDGPFTKLMLQASSYGIHLIVTLGRWSELRMAHQSLFGTRIELRLNDPSDSAIDRKLAKSVPADSRGRALTDAKTLAQFALPTLEAVDPDQVGDALEELAARAAESWSGPAAAPIRLLPNVVDPSSLPDAADEPAAVPLGLRQDTMDTALWDFLDSDQHLVVLGDAKSGKSTALRVIAKGLVERFTPDELAIAVVDPRGKVPGVIPEEYLAAHAKSAAQASGLAASIASELAERPGRTAEELRKTPRVVLLVDDYDIVAAGGTDPLGALVPHLPAARDLGIHIVVTRPVAGSTRGMYAPFLQSTRDTGGALLLLSGDRSEGQIAPRLYAERMPPGRGKYVRRGEAPAVVQLANLPERA